MALSMKDAAELRAAGTSPAAIAHHYDLPADFFALWLGDGLVYSCALWDKLLDQSWEDGASLADAQRAKIDWFADRLAVRGADVLDVGCGWGSLLDRFHREHGTRSGMGLTLSAGQAEFASSRGVPATSFRQQSWVDHDAEAAYDVVTAIESTEHFASDVLTEDEKVEVYRSFFDKVSCWLRDGGRVGLQLICLDNVGHETGRPGRGPVARVIGGDIFPESMSSSLSEMVLAWETHFTLQSFVDHTSHYERTFREWALGYRAHRQAAEQLVGPEGCRTFARYFAAGEVCFRLREQALYRVILAKRPAPKSWAVSLRPSQLTGTIRPAPGASTEAVRSHYDVSNEFYRSWLGPSMMYSSALWSAPWSAPWSHDSSADGEANLEAAHDAKIDCFAAHLLQRPGARVLDVGCGWGANLRALLSRHGATDGVGLTLSAAQQAWIAADPLAGLEIRVEDWAEHAPDDAYDAICSYGAFEHFARDGSSAPERVATYRRFFAACHEWLRPGGRLALETIVHDQAPDTLRPQGRGPLGDFVLGLFPESISPHLGEVVLGFEPWFEVEVLRSDAADFARTFRCWQLRLRANEPAATAATDPDVVRTFRRYLAACEVQFRDGTLTNLRLVLHRRARVRH
jgi:cyclopropane-fatty-acyl-phospholipid synthase